MDILILATSAVTAFCAGLIKATREKLQDAGRAAIDGLSKFLKSKLTNDEEQKALAQVEKSPGDEDFQELLNVHLKMRLKQDQEFLRELTQHVKDVESAGFKIDQEASIRGDDNIIVQGGGKDINIDVN